MARHLAYIHREVNTDYPTERIAENFFKMSIHRRYRWAMDHQLSEAIKIAKAGGVGSPNLVNAKDEYSRYIIPQIEMT